jgi:hypothetical protein
VCVCVCVCVHIALLLLPLIPRTKLTSHRGEQVVTVWARKSGVASVTWFGVLNFGSKWLPWAMLVVSLVLNNNPSERMPRRSALSKPRSYLSALLALMPIASDAPINAVINVMGIVMGILYSALSGSWLLGTPIVLQAAAREHYD